MYKRTIIGLLLFAVLMLVDKGIFPGVVPDWAALVVEVIAVFLIITGAMRARKVYGEKGEDPTAVIPYDSEKQEAVIRCSTCSGEKTAGFKDRETGHFVEVMLINSPEDEQKFKELYKLEEVKTEY